MEQPSSTTGLKFFAAIGTLTLLAIFTLPVFIGYLAVSGKFASFLAEEQTATSTSVVSTSTTIGELGNICGGFARLPCKPGLACSYTQRDGRDTGICVKEEKLELQETGFCELGLPHCAPGYVCADGGEGNAKCISADIAKEDAPRILSVKLEGMSPTDGTYVAAPGTSIRVVLQGTNIKSAKLVIGKADSVAMKKESGGKFTKTFVVEKELLANLAVVAESAPGLTTALWFQVASTDSVR